MVMSAFSGVDSAVLQSVMAALPSENSGRPLDVQEPGPVDWNLPGFAGNVRVGTDFGDLPIEALRIRDGIRTASGRIARVRWIDKIHLDADFMRRHPGAQPVRIPANAFGVGKPLQDMTVSPCQEVCSDAHVASRFLLASQLVSQSRAHRLQTAGVTYYRFHCGDPVVVRCEGVWVSV